MLKIDVERHCRLRGLTSSAAYLRSIGFSFWVSNKLVSDKINSISLYDLEMLCKAFKCTPNDLLEWVPDTKEENTPDHPLASLLNDKSAEKSFNQLSYSQLKELAKIISKER